MKFTPVNDRVPVGSTLPAINAGGGLPTPATTAPAAAADTGGYDTSTPFGQYLSQNQGNRDTWASLNSLLDSYGLSGLSSWAQNEIINGRSQSEVTLDMMNQQTFKDRFPAITQQQATGQNAWTPAQIINYENAAKDTLHGAGLPQGFHDSDQEIQGLLAAGVSTQELTQRVTNGYAAVSQMPQDVKNEWHQLGFTDGDIAAHFLDPDVAEPLLQTQMDATQRAAEAARSGYGQLTGSQATNLAQMGITQAQSEQGFAQLTKQNQLFNPLPGQNGQPGLNQDQQLEATFGNNATLQAQIEQTAKQRVAVSQGGGQFSQSQTGETGVGTAH